MNIRFLSTLAAGAMLLAACGGGGSNALPSGGGASTASLKTSLVDGPFRTSGGTVTAVNIAIAKVEAIGNDGGVQTIATFSPAQQINLLDYQTSPLTLGTASIPAGTYTQLRFVLDTSNANNTSVVVNGTTYPLSIPSATSAGFGGGSSTDNGDGAGTSGIKVRVALNAQAGQTYSYVIDFNAAESIVSAGQSGQWLMKPVLVASAQAVNTAISGTVKNNAGGAVSNAEVDAEQGTTVVNSGVTDANGNFQINALTNGASYTLVVKNSWTNQAGEAQTASGADGTADVTGPTVTAPASAVAITD